MTGGKKESKGPSESNKANPTATLTKEEAKAVKQKMIKGQQADAIVIKASELDRIKESTKIIGKQQEMEEKKRLEAERQKEREAAEVLKQKIKTLDQTREKKMPSTVYQKDEREKNETLLTKAQKAIDEELDDVKHMNKMVHYAKCATIRDKQLEEAKELEMLKKEDDQRMDIMMEIERLKALKYHDEREKARRDSQRQGKYMADTCNRCTGHSGSNKGARAAENEGTRAQGERAEADGQTDR